MNTITWGIIGCGDVAEVKSGPAFQNCKNSSLLAVMRRNHAKAQDFALRHHVPLYYDDAQYIFNHQEITAVYIATPPSTHLQYALDAIKAEKHVYLEKPMTLNAQEAKILCHALKNSKSKLTVAHYRRQLPAFIKVKSLLDEHAIGDVLYADIQILQTKTPSIVGVSEDNWRLKPSISGGGYFHDLAPHQLDLMLSWFGTIKNASGFTSNEHSKSSVATTINGIIQFESGVQFRGLWNFNCAKTNQKEACVIYGTEGSISFSFYGQDVHLNSNGNTTSFSFKNPKHIQEPMIQNTVDYFLGNIKNPCSAEEGLAVMDLMDTFTMSH